MLITIEKRNSGSSIEFFTLPSNIYWQIWNAIEKLEETQYVLRQHGHKFLTNSGRHSFPTFKGRGAWTT